MNEEGSAKDKFFEQVGSLGLTYDDVKLKTGHAEVMPDNVDLKTRFSKKTPMNIPIVSAAMDTVTEHKLAIEIAVLGGIGVIHKNMEPKQQASEVERVKWHLNGKIKKPICVYEDETIEEILNRKKEKDYGFETFPVLNRNGQLTGILSGTDFFFCDNHSLSAREVMTQDPATLSEDATLDEAYRIMKKNKKKAIPLVSSDGKVVGFYTAKDLKRIMARSPTMHNVDKNGQLIVGAAIGPGEDVMERLEKLVDKHVDVIVIDTAHADSKPVFDLIKEIKGNDYDVELVVGNISNPESVKRLLDLGIDGLKVGQGPGSICTTRIIAGIGSPQVTAVYRCVKAAEGYNVPINADGGLKYSGDIPIAIGAGAHSVMVGSMLAGTDESPGKKVYYKGRQWKRYRGMGSMSAMEANQGSRSRYNQEDSGKKELVPEGVEGLVPYKGPLKDVLFQYVGGLKRGMGYVGAADIEELRQKADFVRISAAGQKESHPHDVEVTKEAPNYQTGGD